MENIDTPNPSYKELNLLSKSGEFRIISLFERFKEYIVKHFDANEDNVICDWNKFGATFRYFSDDISLQIKVWQYSNGYLKLPELSSRSMRPIIPCGREKKSLSSTISS